MNAKTSKAAAQGAENPASIPGDESQTSTQGDESPTAAQGMDNASGAIIESEIKEGIQMGHASIDANPREGTTPQQNARDMNDPRRRKPNDRDFQGQGIDPAPYGRKAAPKAKKKGRK
jgi:hypothetical protein